VPLVLGVGGALTKSSSGLNGFADRYGFVAAYPNPGLIDNPDESAQRAARIKYLTDVIDHLKGTENIDPNRIYAMGGSQSAVQSYRLACVAPAKLAAIGSVAGALTVGDASTCKPPGPVSIVEVHGTADTAIPYGGNQFVLSTPATNSFWRNNDGCPQQATSSTRGRVKVETWSGCESGTAVRLITYTGGGHGWPRNADIDATAELWAFFSQHSRAKEALATVLRVTSVGRMKRTLLIRIKLTADATVQATLLRARRAYASKLFHVVGGNRSLRLVITKKAPAGSYTLKLTVSATDGSKQTVQRSVRLARSG
jgi:polyhydroxybutyrate depolymerase